MEQSTSNNNQKDSLKDLELTNKKENKLFLDNFPYLWKYTDLDRLSNLLILIAIRILQAVFITNQLVNPDEYWQSIEVAYKWVYGGDVNLPWEWSDQWQLRNTLYPFYLSLPLRLVKYVGIDTNFVVRITPYLAHCPFVILNDIFTWKVAKRVIGV